MFRLRKTKRRKFLRQRKRIIKLKLIILHKLRKLMKSNTSLIKKLKKNNLQSQAQSWKKEERLLNLCLLNQSWKTLGLWKNRKLKTRLILKLMRMKTTVLLSSSTSSWKRETRRFFKLGDALCVTFQLASTPITKTRSRCLRRPLQK